MGQTTVQTNCAHARGFNTSFPPPAACRCTTRCDMATLRPHGPEKSAVPNQQSSILGMQSWHDSWQLHRRRNQLSLPPPRSYPSPRSSIPRPATPAAGCRPQQQSPLLPGPAAAALVSAAESSVLGSRNAFQGREILRHRKHSGRRQRRERELGRPGVTSGRRRGGNRTPASAAAVAARMPPRHGRGDLRRDRPVVEAGAGRQRPVERRRWHVAKTPAAWKHWTSRRIWRPKPGSGGPLHAHRWPTTSTHNVSLSCRSP